MFYAIPIPRKDIQSLKKKYRVMFMGNQSSTHLWGAVIDKALAALGGQGKLDDIYREIEGGASNRYKALEGSNTQGTTTILSKARRGNLGFSSSR